MSVTVPLREAVYGCVAAIICLALFLLWLWRPERQIKRHTENFFYAVEHKNWARAGDFIAGDYHDQWNDDRARVLQRMHEGFRYMRDLKISAFNVSVQMKQRRGEWSGRIWLDGSPSEVTELLKEQVNSLQTPFDLEWRRVSWKPWDWRLVRAGNSGLQIQTEAY